jgi:hypothetical protein
LVQQIADYYILIDCGILVTYIEFATNRDTIPGSFLKPAYVGLKVVGTEIERHFG